jgi:hypothetical protein
MENFENIPNSVSKD